MVTMKLYATRILRGSLATYVALLVWFAVSGYALSAAAQSQPGESRSWAFEYYNNGSSVIQTSNVVAEAYNGNTRFDGWRANDASGALWFCANGGPAFQIGYTNSNSAPTIVPWGAAGGMAVFQTGTDNHVYWAWNYVGTELGDPSEWSAWTRVPNNVLTSKPVGATELGEEEIELAWTGLNDEIYTTYFDPQTFQWSQGVDTGGRTNYGPSVAYSEIADSLFLVATGTDHSLWVTDQKLGQTNWNPWASWGSGNGNGFYQSPTVAVAPYSGAGQIVDVDGAGNVWYHAIGAIEGPDYWTRESAGAISSYRVSLSPMGYNIYSLWTNFAAGSNYSEWKQSLQSH
jgi:hypothetical protein